PDAGADGYVVMPNVTLPHEMVDLVTASRAYEANLKSMESFRQMAEQALSLLRGLG
ncbi:MAG: flagellar basal body rod protein FlgC, partial [Fuerstiella sp.]|nr:flagellar basal body rod protein FlgC [Fuerstiella sp.]